MQKLIMKLSPILFVSIFSYTFLNAQTATILVDSNVQYQRVTGFGGFVNSPQFGYNHMTEAQIRQLWGENSEMGYNIMRLFIPVGENNWAQAIPTAQLAQSLGIKIFASPWSPPAQWKTNNSVNGVVIRNGEEDIGYLKEEHYEDYALYLNNFVVLMQENGVELAGISIQNEPDYKVTYQGCLWTPEQIANFIKEYGHIITCPIIAAESVGVTDNYVYPFLEDEDAFNNLGIFGGHQYGPIQSAHKQLQERGMEVWQTEFLINWNANLSTDRDFDWAIDAFDFAKAVNTAMLSDINAWVHYASKRYYGMLGDGIHGTQDGVITKRGYILSHFAQYATGTTRINSSWRDGASMLDGSAYLSVSGDSVIVKVINPTNDEYALTVDLPFFTNWGKSIVTTIDNDMADFLIDISNETFRPKVNIAASSFTTLVFRKGADRPISEMVGEPVYYNRIEDQIVTNPAFGSNYQLSGQTVVFDHSNSLISPFTNSNNGYLELDDRYNTLVFHIKSISSPATYTSANTTLYYINGAGAVRSHNYGTLAFNQQGSSNWVLDISKNVLTDGCKGIVGITNGNWTSVLTITFGDVYFLLGDEKMYKFSGTYSSGDSRLMDALEDIATTSIDFTETTGISSDLNWNAKAANHNSIFYVSSDVSNSNPNVITETICNELILSEQGGSFYVPYDFIANSATYTRSFNGYGIMVLPFEAVIPADVTAYTLEYSSNQVNGTSIVNTNIPANTPVLIVGNGTFTFTGSGEVTTPRALSVNDMNCVYVSVKVPANSYSLATVGGVTSFRRVISGSEPIINPFNAYFDIGNLTSVSSLPLVLDGVVSNINNMEYNEKGDANGVIFDLWGRPVSYPHKGVIYIKNGKKIIFRD